MMFFRTHRGLMLGLALSLASALSWGQAFPSKPIQVVVPVAAGGGTDLLARTLGQKVAPAARPPEHRRMPLPREIPEGARCEVCGKSDQALLGVAWHDCHQCGGLPQTAL